MAANRLALFAVLGMATISLSTNTFAMLSVPYGWYLEANAGSTKAFDQTFPANSSVNQSGVGGGLNLGYKFAPFFALEAGYTRYANQTIKDQLGATAADNTNYAWDLTFKGIMPATDTGFEVFGKSGVQRLYSRISLQNSQAAANIPLSANTSSASGLFVGVGGQYYFMPEFAVVGQWTRAKGNGSTGTLDLYSIGVSFIMS